MSDPTSGAAAGANSGTKPSYRGRFVWFDLNTTDEKAAQAFYTSVAGWGIDQWDMGGAIYYMWKVGNDNIGGMREFPPAAREQGAHPHWLGYIATEDVAATVKQAESLGATVMVQPTAIPTVGTFAVLRDPQGAVFAAYTPAGDAPGHEGMPTPGDISWYELATKDINAALDFYGALFGWTLSSDMDMGPNGIYRIFARNGQMMGGMYNVSDAMPMPPSWTFYINVDDIHAAAARVTAAGGAIMQPPMEVPGGMIFLATDPQGAVFAGHAISAS